MNNINIYKIKNTDFIKKIFKQHNNNLVNNKVIFYKSFENKIKKVFNLEKQQFGRGNFYQSFEKLNIKGLRPTNYRIKKYNLLKYLKKDDKVLNIGSNVGFLDLTLSEYVNNITGIEYNKYLYNIANMTKDFLNIKNVNFINQDFNKAIFKEKFNVVLSFAVHYWLQINLKDYIEKIYNLLEKDGIFVIESHETIITDIDFDKNINNFINNKFEILYYGKIKDDNIIERNFFILKKL